MESFRVICETCGARLKVRDTSVIGEIHACPKCESMVQIVPPASRQTASTEPLVAAVQPTQEPTTAVVLPTIDYVEAIAPPAPVAAVASPFVFWGVGGATLLLVGLAVGVWAGGRRAGGDSEPVAAIPNLNVKTEDRVASDPYAVDAAAEAVDEPMQLKAVELPVAPVAQSSASDLPAAPGLPEVPPEERAIVAETEEPATGVEIESEETAASTTSKRQPPPVLRFDPLDFDPARLSLAGGTSSAAGPSAGSIEDDPASEVEIKREVLPVEAAADLLPPPARDETLQVRLGPLPSETPGSKSAGEQLALSVNSLELSKMPLVRFIDLLSEIGGAPITLDPLALELAGVSPHAAVSIQAQDATLESLLQDALSKRRLGCIEHDEQLRVVLHNGEAKRSVDHEVKDLVDGDAKMLAEMIQRFVAPTTWQAAGGQATIGVDGTALHVDQAQAVHHEILVFCERLRLARGLAVRSRYPAERLSIEDPYEAVRSKLDERATFTFLAWNRLVDVVDYWQQETGLTILVDWSALAAVELGRSSPIACSAIDRSWEEVFDGILEPLDLAWWPVDGETIQITTGDALAEIQRVEFYAVPQSLRDQFANGESLAELSATSWELDGPSGRLVVLAPPTVHRTLSQRLAGAGK